jgi:hypothetical protein
MSTKIITIELLQGKESKGLFDMVIIKVVHKKITVSSFTATDTDATVGIKTVEG